VTAIALPVAILELIRDEKRQPLGHGLFGFHEMPPTAFEAESKPALLYRTQEPLTTAEAKSLGFIVVSWAHCGILAVFLPNDNVSYTSHRRMALIVELENGAPQGGGIDRA
jgi:hypothetical protein